MEERAREILLCVLKAIKYRADISPNETPKELKRKREILLRNREENAGLVISTNRFVNLYFDLLEGKHIKLFRSDLNNCDVSFDEDGLGNILKKLEQNHLLKYFRFKEDRTKGDRYEIILPKNFSSLYENYISKLEIPENSKKEGRKYQIKAVENQLKEGLKEERIAKNVVKKMQVTADVFKGNDSYEISAKDRKIWVNETYMISKPHAIGSNLEFFLYLLENPDMEIKRNELPQRIRDEIGKKRFIAILNALGFKGEILKLFFPKRGKTSLLFNQKVSKSELDNRGIKENILLNELVLAHSKNSPE